MTNTNLSWVDSYKSDGLEARTPRGEICMSVRAARKSQTVKTQVLLRDEEDNDDVQCRSRQPILSGAIKVHCSNGMAENSRSSQGGERRDLDETVGN